MRILWAGKICWATCVHPYSPNIRLQNKKLSSQCFQKISRTLQNLKIFRKRAGDCVQLLGATNCLKRPCPLKTENQGFYDVFKGHRKRKMTWNGLMFFLRQSYLKKFKPKVFHHTRSGVKWSNNAFLPIPHTWTFEWSAKWLQNNLLI